MTFRDLRDAVLKRLRVDGRTRAGRALKAQAQRSKATINEYPWTSYGYDSKRGTIGVLDETPPHLIIATDGIVTIYRDE